MKIYEISEASGTPQYPILTNGQIYIYALENIPHKNIKIGKTTNINQRVSSLSGSNGGGSKISRVYISPCPTWMQSIERNCHNHFHFCRIKGTEWFDGSKITLEEVVNYIDSLFYSKDFNLCNNTRYNFIINHKDILSDANPSNFGIGISEEDKK